MVWSAVSREPYGNNKQHHTCFPRPQAARKKISAHDISDLDHALEEEKRGGGGPGGGEVPPPMVVIRSNTWLGGGVLMEASPSCAAILLKITAQHPALMWASANAVPGGWPQLFAVDRSIPESERGGGLRLGRHVQYLSCRWPANRHHTTANRHQPPSGNRQLPSAACQPPVSARPTAVAKPTQEQAFLKRGQTTEACDAARGLCAGFF